MPDISGPLIFWDLKPNEAITGSFVLIGCFVLYVYLLKRAEEAKRRRRSRKWREQKARETRN